MTVQSSGSSGGKPALKVLLCSPRGFCAGVVRAIAAVERALDAYGAPVYVRHEIVHNRYVVEQLARRGAVFVEELDEIPDTDAPVVFSAHGVPRAVAERAAERNFFAIDATCPLVTKVHREAILHHRRGHHVILVGHAGHPEVVGTIGQLPPGAVTLVEGVREAETFTAPEGAALAFVTQTTLSVDDAAEIIAALTRRFPDIAGPRREDICYATTNRQDAVKRIAPQVDAMLVVGAPNSSNSQRLRDVAERSGCPRAFLVQRARDIDWDALGPLGRLGIAAGASAPEVLVEEVLEALVERYALSVETVTSASEDVKFPLPRGLRSVVAAE